MITQYDHEERRCPMLGHPVKFHYCRSMERNSPCRKILDCWFERFPVVEFMQEHFPPETIEKLAEPPKPKIVSILELIEQAKANSKSVK